MYTKNIHAFKPCHCSSALLYLALVHLSALSGPVVRKDCLSPDTEHHFQLLSTQQLKEKISKPQPGQLNPIRSTIRSALLTPFKHLQDTAESLQSPPSPQQSKGKASENCVMGGSSLDSGNVTNHHYQDNHTSSPQLEVEMCSSLRALQFSLQIQVKLNKSAQNI